MEPMNETVTARIAFVLVDGKFAGPLAESLADIELMQTTIPQKADASKGDAA